MREMHLLVLLLLIVWLTIICCEAKSEIDNNNNNNNNNNKSKGIECTESERDALLEFQRGINVDRCGVLDSWGVGQDCCLWRGIKCHSLSGHIISLSLRTSQTPESSGDGNQETCLDGTVSVSILDLKHLKYLDLSYNRFQGQIPKFIGSLVNLEYLNLSYAGFTGVIPREIGNLSRLTSLDLNYVHYYSDYNIRVESLWWLSQLTLLREVNLGGIDLSLTSNNWVSIVNNLPFLQVLRLDDCQLSLKLPLDSSLSYRSTNFSTTLGIISLRRNNFNDTSIFEWLYDLGRVRTNLFYLDLSDNQQLFESDFQQTGLNILGNLCNLQTLELFNTGLNYSFSDIIQSLSICSYKSLMYLGLNSNQIWGSIPENISNLSYLKELYVENNELNGPISQALGKLSMLETLSLSFNPLKGVLTGAHLSNLSRLSILSLVFNTELVLNISANWVPPFQLDELYLRSCQVGPDFPIWLTTQKNLTIIDITNTSISDTIPVSFFTSLSPKLKALAMSRNMMYGILPNVSITFEALPLIDLSSNNFSGAIPLFLRNVSALRLNNNHFSKGLVAFLCPQTKMPLMYLHLANNAFSDKLPNCWGYFDKLLVLHLENNKLWGNLPISMGSLNQLNSLHLSSNNLSGELPESLLNCSSLIILDLAHNLLSGYIPSTLGKVFKNLSIIILRDNNFSGTLPSSLCRLTRLQMLDFSNNHIRGTIPRCIYNLKGMVTADSRLQDISLVYMQSSIENNDNALIMWKGKEQNFEDDYLLGHNKVIDFSNNILEGQIPEGISILVGLKQINLSRNHLSGAITPKIGQLTSLESLDLSHNHISGEIPVSLAKISSLEVLDLLYNNLSGRIPDGTQLQSFNTSAYMGNLGLCGAPLPKCDGDEAAIIPKNLDKEQPSDNFMVGVYISVVLGLIFGFWGVCGTLVVKSSWRHAFFRFYDDIKDKIYVVVITNVQRVWRRT